MYTYAPANDHTHTTTLYQRLQTTTAAADRAWDAGDPARARALLARCAALVTQITGRTGEART